MPRAPIDSVRRVPSRPLPAMAGQGGAETRARLERGCTRQARRVEHGMARLARLRPAALAIVAVLALANAALLTGLRYPIPIYHDEFSYLLAADTFAHGRLSNPTHPLWPVFETFHVLQQPTYVSKYPPGQGLALAAGQWLTGRPIVGAWLTATAGCVAVCWMLFGWSRPRWALLGGLLATTHPLILSWSHTYWGGSVAMIGGALWLGGLGRLMRNDSLHAGDTLAMTTGLVVLANSRPFEGLVLAILSAPWFLRGLHRSDGSWKPIRREAVLPAASLLLLAGACMVVYNLRTTGQPFRMPYMVYEQTYSRTPIFHGQAPRPERSYRHDELNRFFNEWEYGFYQDETRSWRAFADYAAKRAVYFLVYELPGAFGPLGLCAVLASPALMRRRSPARWVPAILLGFFGSLLLETARPQAHYAAPAFGLVILWLVLGLRALATWRPAGRSTGRVLARVLVAVCLVSLPLVYDDLIHLERDPDYSWQMRERAAWVEALNRLPGSHLVLVHFSPDHPVKQEWVWNEADIDRAHIVWARAPRTGHDRELLAYFADRRIWRIEPDNPNRQRPPGP